MNIVAQDGNLQVGYDESGQFVSVQTDGDMKTMQHIHDLRGKTCVICRRKWTNEASDLVNYHQLDGMVAHRSCYEGHLSLDDYNMFVNAMVKAKFRFDVKAIPNEYKGAWDSSWYVSTLLDFPGVTIKFGSRKRVWVVHLHADKDLSVPSDFLAEEDVTRIVDEKSVLIHAWTREKVNEYISKISVLLNKK